MSVCWGGLGSTERRGGCERGEKEIKGYYQLTLQEKT